MLAIKRGVMLGVLGLVGLLVATGCAGPVSQNLEEGTAMTSPIPQIDLNRPAITETATFALG